MLTGKAMMGEWEANYTNNKASRPRDERFTQNTNLTG